MAGAVSDILGWFNPTRWLMLAGILAALGGAYAWRVHVERDFGREEVRAEWTLQMAKQTQAALVAVQQARDEEHRQTAAVQKEADDARKELAALRGSYDGAVTAGQRLRQQLAAACRGGGAATAAAAASGGAPADPAADLYAHVQRRLEEAENGTIRFADESHIAGRACERSYDAIEVKP